MGNLGMGSANFMEMQQRMQVCTVVSSSSSSSLLSVDYFRESWCRTPTC